MVAACTLIRCSPAWHQHCDNGPLFHELVNSIRSSMASAGPLQLRLDVYAALPRPIPCGCQFHQQQSPRCVPIWHLTQRSVRQLKHSCPGMPPKQFVLTRCREATPSAGQPKAHISLQPQSNAATCSVLQDPRSWMTRHSCSCMHCISRPLWVPALNPSLGAGMLWTLQSGRAGVGWETCPAWRRCGCMSARLKRSRLGNSCSTPDKHFTMQKATPVWVPVCCTSYSHSVHMRREPARSCISLHQSTLWIATCSPTGGRFSTPLWRMEPPQHLQRRVQHRRAQAPPQMAMLHMLSMASLRMP